MNNPDHGKQRLGPLPTLIFASRWLQLPLYLGLILAQGVYVYRFCTELMHLIEAMFGSQKALAALVEGLGYKANPILNAEGEKQASILRAEGEAAAIQNVFDAGIEGTNTVSNTTIESKEAPNGVVAPFRSAR